MKLIAGLGNPGKEYARTRHNSGFMAIDRLADKLGVSITVEKFEGLTGRIMVDGQSVVLLKPQTYMNESGRSVAAAVHYYHIEPQDILILHDDMDLPVGTVRIRASGSSGGQKGMQSIIDALGTSDIARVRIGVGHSAPGEHELVPDWVLSPVPKAQAEEYDAALETAAQAARLWLRESLDVVMSRCSRKARTEIKSE